MKYSRHIIFTKIPLKKRYRYKDVFQIFPCDFQNKPEPDHYSHFPVVLELVLNSDEILPLPEELQAFQELLGEVRTFRKRTEEIITLLSIFTNHEFFIYEDVDGNWGVNFPNESEVIDNNVKSKWTIPMYFFPEMPIHMQINELSNTSYADIELIESNEYYTFKPNLDYKKKSEIKFPNNINILFDQYFEIHGEEMNKLQRAIFFINSSVKYFKSNYTMSIISTFTGIETMMSIEFKNEKRQICNSCGQTKYGIRQKFVLYLSKYIDASTDKVKKYKYYYDLRSKIVHTGEHLESDKFLPDLTREKHETEIQTRFEIIQLGRLSVCNWLSKRNN